MELLFPMKPAFLSLVLIAFCFVHAGCTSSGSLTVSPKEFVQDVQGANGGQVAGLVSGDAIELSVEVDGRMEVIAHRAGINPSGMVTLPLVGDVRIGGMTVGAARDLIAKTYGRYFVNPPVIMLSRVEDSVQGEWGFVTVTGQVGQPGRVKVESASGIKLTSAIQEAGGFADSAKKNDIRVSRKGSDGRKIQVKVDYEEIGQKGNVEADIDLKDGDVVYVPQRIF